MSVSARLLLLLALVVSACGPSYVLAPPPAFKRFQKTRAFEMISADGVMLKAREVENYPRADLPFWTDALKRHMDERGYGFKSDRCFETARGLGGCTLDFIVPRGAEDWVLSETIFIEGETIYVVEVAGPFDRYAKVEAALAESLKTFAPEP